MSQQAWSPSLLAEETAMEGLVPLPWEGGSEKWPKVQGAEQGRWLPVRHEVLAPNRSLEDSSPPPTGET